MLSAPFFLLPILTATIMMQTTLSNPTARRIEIPTVHEQCKNLGFSGACYEKLVDRHKICSGLDCGELFEGALYYTRISTIPAQEGTPCDHEDFSYGRCDGKGNCTTWNHEWAIPPSVGDDYYVSCNPRPLN